MGYSKHRYQLDPLYRARMKRYQQNYYRKHRERKLAAANARNRAKRAAVRNRKNRHPGR
jgi:hypothetical protein